MSETVSASYHLQEITKLEAKIEWLRALLKEYHGALMENVMEKDVEIERMNAENERLKVELRKWQEAEALATGNATREQARRIVEGK